MSHDGPDSSLLGRLEAFSDVVFGFAVFMLATNVKVPATPSELAGSGRALVVFAASFAVLCGLWFRHHRLMRRYYYPDPLGNVLVFATLGTVALYSYPLQLYLRFPSDHLVFAAYAGGFAMLCLLAAAMIAHGAWRRRHEWDAPKMGAAKKAALSNLALSLAMVVFAFVGKSNEWMLALPVAVILLRVWGGPKPTPA